MLYELVRNLLRGHREKKEISRKAQEIYETLPSVISDDVIAELIKHQKARYVIEDKKDERHRSLVLIRSRFL